MEAQRASYSSTFSLSYINAGGQTLKRNMKAHLRHADRLWQCPLFGVYRKICSD
jgi:hypothetical protein